MVCPERRLLLQSVALLYRNYNRVQHDPVRFLYRAGEFSSAAQGAVLDLCVPGTAQFVPLPAQHFAVPSQVSRNKWLFARKFSVGYRHMIRFFTIGLWALVREWGFSYVMRLDEESFVWSPIEYNLFRFMHSREMEYGFRLAAWERGAPTGRRSRCCSRHPGLVGGRETPGGGPFVPSAISEPVLQVVATRLNAIRHFGEAA